MELVKVGLKFVLSVVIMDKAWKTCIECLAPIWKKFSVEQQCVFRAIVPGILQCISQSKSIARDCKNPKPYLYLMALFSAFCIRTGHRKGTALRLTSSME